MAKSIPGRVGWESGNTSSEGHATGRPWWLGWDIQRFRASTLEHVATTLFLAPSIKPRQKQLRPLFDSYEVHTHNIRRDYPFSAAPEPIEYSRQGLTKSVSQLARGLIFFLASLRARRTCNLLLIHVWHICSGHLFGLGRWTSRVVGVGAPRDLGGVARVPVVHDFRVVPVKTGCNGS